MELGRVSKRGVVECNGTVGSCAAEVAEGKAAVIVGAAELVVLR